MKPPKQAMVLAAGLGRRMRPLTDHLPKPLIEVAGRSLIDRAIDRLEEAGVGKIVVNVSYKAELLESHLSKRAGPKILFSREEEPLETGGGILKALPHFGNAPFYAVNGDVIWLDENGSALKRLAEYWEDRLEALLLLHPVEKAMGYGGAGDFALSARRVTRRAAGGIAPLVYAGVQLLSPELFTQAPSGAFSLNRLYDRAMAAGPPRLEALVHHGEWLHVGDVEGLRLAEERLGGRLERDSSLRSG